MSQTETAKAVVAEERTEETSSPSEKHGWRVYGGMMGPIQ